MASTSPIQGAIPLSTIRKIIISSINQTLRNSCKLKLIKLIFYIMYYYYPCIKLIIHNSRANSTIKGEILKKKPLSL